MLSFAEFITELNKAIKKENKLRASKKEEIDKETNADNGDMSSLFGIGNIPLYMA